MNPTEQLLAWTQRPIGAKALMRERMIRLLPHFEAHIRYPIIKIAGTNGKGSTAAMLSAALTHAGKRPMLFTSPHLEHLSERFRMCNTDIRRKALEALAADVLARLQAFVATEGTAYTPSFFEALVCMALVWADREGSDIAIIEAGVGGFNDATHLLPDVGAIITSIGLDHAAQLGDSITAIARDKAGIAQPHSTLILGSALPDTALTAIRTIAEHRKVTWTSATSVECRPLQHGVYRLSWQQTSVAVRLPLLGDFQRDNLQLVARMWAHLMAQGIVSRWNDLAGIQHTRWAGRMESIGPFLLDAAHNEAALQALHTSLAPLTSPEECLLIVGISAEKDVAQMTPWLLKMANGGFLVDDFYKARPTADWQAPFPAPHWRPLPLREAIQNAAAQAPRHIVVTGSIFMLGKARALILDHLTQMKA